MNNLAFDDGATEFERTMSIVGLGISREKIEIHAKKDSAIVGTTGFVPVLAADFISGCVCEGSFGFYI